MTDAALKDPKNAQLQEQKTTLFQGETLRGLLLFLLPLLNLRGHGGN